MPLIGVDVAVEDEAVIARLPTATDTIFLLTADANAPANPTLVDSAARVRADFPTATDTIAETDTLFGEGAGRVYVVKIADAVNLTTTLDKLPAELGPGQVVAPAVITATDIRELADWAFATNRVYLANGPDTATDAQLVTLATAVISGSDGRYAGLWADVAEIPGAGGNTREVPASLVVAGMIARNDLQPGGGNPNLAVAGVNVLPQYAIGVTAERSDAARDTLTAAQVNTFKTVAGQLRNYGYRTLADLGELPQWWDLGGSRTVMDVRAHIRSASEDAVFAQIDGDANAENRVNGLASARCLELVRLRALFNRDANGEPIAPFTVDTSRAVNPVSQVAQGRVKARVGLRTSPYVEHLDVTIVKHKLA